MNRLRLAALLGAALALLLAACGTAAPPRLHSLLAEPLRAAAAGPAWRLAPLAVPAQVDRPQFVLRRADGSLVVLERERWQAPLQDELRDALAEQLAASLGPAERAAIGGRAEWRITLDVQRFDSVPGRATLVAQWHVQSALNRRGQRCSVHLAQAVGDGVPALVGGHQRNLQRLAAGVAAGVAALDAGHVATCPG